MFYNKDFRNKIRQLDKDALAQLMIDSETETSIKVLANTKNTFYFVIPAKVDNLNIELQSVQGGGALGSYGTLSSFGCASSTISTNACASTAGST